MTRKGKGLNAGAAAAAALCLGVVTNKATALPLPPWLHFLDTGIAWLLVVIFGLTSIALAIGASRQSGSSELIRSTSDVAVDSGDMVVGGRGNTANQQQVQGDQYLAPVHVETIEGSKYTDSMNSQTVKGDYYAAPSQTQNFYGDTHFTVGNAEPAPPRQGMIVEGEIPGRPAVFLNRPEFIELREALSSDGAHVVLLGSVGVGKSQLAAAAVRAEISAETTLVAWLRGETEAALIADMARLATVLSVADPNGQPSESAAKLKSLPRE